MKTLIFVRHGKSSWEHNTSDKERPLTERGKRDAHLIASAFNTKNYSVDLICSSPANRAYSTCKIFSEHLYYPNGNIKVINQLYDFEGNAVINFIKNLDNTYNTVLLFGHNHAFTAIVNLFGDRYIENIPTSGLVVLTFSTDEWQFIKHGQTQLILFPRDFKH
jgi:phosphohistidine phosphatase